MFVHKLAMFIMNENNRLQMILRKNTLFKLFGTERLACQLIGHGGAGKSTTLFQISDYLAELGRTPQLIVLHSHEHFSLVAELIIFAHENGLSGAVPKLPEKAIEEIPANEILAVIRDILIALRDRNCDEMLVIIDDIHLLPTETVNQLELLFAENSPLENMRLVLAGRKQVGRFEIVNIDGFSDDEFHQYLNRKFHSNWTKENTEVTQWLFDLTKGNPLFISVLLDKLAKDELIIDGFTAPIDVLQSQEIPSEITQIVELQFDFNELNEQEQTMLKMLACSQKGLRLKEMKILSGQTANGVITSLKTKKWIQNGNNCYCEFYHPVVREIVESKITSTEKETIHRKFLERFPDLSVSVQAFHILHFSSVSKRQKEILLVYASQMEKQGMFHSANENYLKIDPKGSNPELVYRIGRNLQRIGNKDESFKMLKKIANREFPNKWRVYLYLGMISSDRGEFAKSEEFYKTGMNLKGIPEDGKWQLSIQCTSSLMRQRKLDAMNQLVESLENEIDKSPKHKLDFYRLQSTINQLYPFLPDTIAHNQKAAKFAKDLGNSTYETYFEGCQMVYYIYQGDLEKVEYFAKRILKSARQRFDQKHELGVYKTLSNAYNMAGKKVQAIQYYKRTLNKMKSIGYRRDMILFQQGLAQSYQYLGHFPKAEQTFIEMQKELNGNPHTNAQALKALAQFYAWIGKKKQAKEIFEQVIEIARKHKLETVLKQVQLTMYSYEAHQNSKLAEKAFVENVKSFKKMGRQNYLHRSYYGKAKVLANSGDIVIFEKLMQEWDEIQEPKTPVIKNIAEIMLMTLQGKIALVSYVLQKLESQFNGVFLWDYRILYEWLAKQKQFCELRGRFQFMAQTLEAICFCKTDAKIKTYQSYLSGLARLLYQWQMALGEQKQIPEHIVNQFALNKEQYEMLIENLSVWNIQVGDGENPNFVPKEPIIINLFGKPKIYIGNKLLNNKDGATTGTIKLLAYLIIKGWTHRNGVSKKKMIRDIWNPAPENMEKTINAKDKAVSRLQKLFERTPEKMIIQDDDTIAFNWEHLGYRLDIDKFWDESEIGLKLFHSGDFDGALVHLNHSAGLFSGGFVENIEARWLDPIRAEFFIRFVGIMKAIGVILLEQEQYSELVKKLKPLVKSYPEVEEFSKPLNIAMRK